VSTRNAVPELHLIRVDKVGWIGKTLCNKISTKIYGRTHTLTHPVLGRPQSHARAVAARHLERGSRRGLIR
jgi:hypothetical protein